MPDRSELSGPDGGASGKRNSQAPKPSRPSSNTAGEGTPRKNYEVIPQPESFREMAKPPGGVRIRADELERILNERDHYEGQLGALISAAKQWRNATESRLRLLDSRGEAAKSMLKADRDLIEALERVDG